ncbi:DUF3253 domain-containing protein [Phycicoccus flavus]|uniref:DUF3253 domain-containing protein n=1 Tax=Phycicoccus flavus TaxID=2502783 RepID=A0A8T6RBG2_9MICO|nr:DUF3253 domain-containing protein [Phycicoccus flavus]NHA70165.1 DUF3253 domain-containing protein [Phycicoccus flavus]
MGDAADGAREVQRTEDGHHIVVDGRRWRATDPGIPERLRSELVAELMAARRLVRTEGDAVRHRVQDAKVALGERGAPWWEPVSEADRAERATAAFRALLRHRPEGTVCPSEVARVVGGEDWRGLSAEVRALAFDRAADGELAVLQKGEAVERGARGPVRVGRGPTFAD